MALTLDQKRFIFGIGGGVALFWLMKETLFKRDVPFKVSQPKDDDIHQALLAYEDALSKGESADALAEFNDELASEFGVKVFKQSDGTLVARDTNGVQVGKL